MENKIKEGKQISFKIMSCRIPSNEVKYYIFKGKLKFNWDELFDSYEEAFEKVLFESPKQIKL